jgi:diguanylate cyclase (GGDEF)-like protein/PAS domain S-box-containing protein
MPSANEVVRGKIRAAQISTIITYTPWMMLANIFNASAVLVAFYGNLYQTRAMVWAVCVIALSLAVTQKWLASRKKSKPKSVSLTAIKRAVLNAAMLGSLWGISGPLLYPFADADGKLVVICVLAGMLCGSGFALSTVPAAAITFAGTIAIGMIAAISMTPSLSSGLIFVMAVIYVAIIVRSSMSLSYLLSERMLSEVNSAEQRDVIGLLLNDFTENASDWLWVIDKNLEVTQVSSRLSALTGHPETYYIGQHISKCMPLLDEKDQTAEDIESVRQLKQALRKRVHFKDIVIPVFLNGEKRLWSFSAKPVVSENGNFNGFRGVGRDLTEELAAKAKNAYLAHYDTLTQLPNRLLFHSDLELALARYSRTGEQFAVLLLDLDHFKSVNDTQGHPEGDLLLQQVAQRLLVAVRDMDTVARLGGDEFAIILSGIEKPHEAARLAQRLGVEIARPFTLTSSEAVIGVSIGIAIGGKENLDADTLLRHADLALYRAKNDGRGGFHFFEPEMDAAARRRHQLEADLRNSIRLGELELFFQPLVHIETRAVNTFEALIRWNHPKLGLLNPNEFIPLAEEVGLVQNIGSWVIREACHQAMKWPSHIRVAVNLSPVQFRSASLFTQIQSALEETGLAPERLELEVTESLLLDATSHVEGILTALRALGVRISLDDFGTGYSSLSYLQKFKFDKIKIDRSFVNNIETEPGCQAIMDCLIRLAKDLHMSLVVEGVETEAQLDSLKERGCVEIQGFLIAQPGDVASLNQFFEPVTIPVTIPAQSKAAA